MDRGCWLILFEEVRGERRSSTGCTRHYEILGKRVSASKPRLITLPDPGLSKCSPVL
jgi:hypothetical protein